MQGVKNRLGISRRIYHVLLERGVDAAASVVAVDEGTVGRHKERPFFIYSHALEKGRCSMTEKESET